jgi:hypothetical protein
MDFTLGRRGRFYEGMDDMSKKIIIVLALTVFSAAAAPAQAWPHYQWGRGFYHRPACLPLGYFTFGSHLGLGPGYPGLYAPPPVLQPYGWAPVASYGWYHRRPVTTAVILPGNPARAHVDESPRAPEQAGTAAPRDTAPRSLDWYVMYSAPRSSPR